MKVEFETNVGQKRQTNQDAVAIYSNTQNVSFAMVADGMGGHQAGDVASRQAITLLGGLWEMTTFSSETNQEEVIQWLIRAIQQANEEIFQRAEKSQELYGMGTTVVAVVLFANTYLVANVGDSRCYLVRSGKLRQITEDHSLVNVLVQQGEISPEMAAHHPRKNVLTRSVGMPGDIDVDVTSLEAVTGDYLLLCTDGLTNMLPDDEILTIIEGDIQPKRIVRQLVKKANEAGGTDNITVLLVKNDGKEQIQND